LVIFGLFTAFFIVLGAIMDEALNLPWPVPKGISWAAAFFLMVIGAAITAWSVFSFHKSRGTPVPVNPPPVLIVSGPYKYARNPMLMGVFLLMFGLGFAMHSLSLTLVFTPLYILAHAWELKQIEEPELIKRFGNEFLTYRRLTPMFFPGIQPKK
jgi:protein-S-isoprenylcysteine O-methyltransferase Ste14